MIKVSVMYPNLPGARFDHEYYRDKHMPLVKARMGETCKFYTVDKRYYGRSPRCAGYLPRHVPYLLPFDRSVSGWLRTSYDGDHGGHPELHRPISGDSDKPSGYRLIRVERNGALLAGLAPIMQSLSFSRIQP